MGCMGSEEQTRAQTHQINEEIDTSGVEVYKYSDCANKKRRGMSDIGLDRLDELQKKVKDDREFVSVDGLFRRQSVFMENLVKKHRERMGNVDSSAYPPQPKKRKRGL